MGSETVDCVLRMIRSRIENGLALESFGPKRISDDMLVRSAGPVKARHGYPSYAGGVQ